MKGIRLMIICVLLLGFNACSDEDDIHVNVEDSLVGILCCFSNQNI